MTLVGIYFQLRVARSANAFDQLDRFDEQLNSERMLRHKAAILAAIQDGATPPEYPQWAVVVVADFWERIGSLSRAGHIDPKLLRHNSGPDSQVWWGILEPIVGQWRNDEGDPTIYENFEWVATTMDRLDAEVRVPKAVTPDLLDRTLDRRLASMKRAIENAEDLRTVIIKSPDFLTSPATGQVKDMAATD